MGKKKGISAANVIAVIGVVTLGVLTYLGHAFISGGEMGMSIMWAIIVATIAASLLILMVVAKGAENHFEIWKIIEYSALVLYLAFAALTATTVVHFFVVNGQKEELKKYAKADVQAINDLIYDYNIDRENTIVLTIASIDYYNNSSRNKLTQKEITDSLRHEGLIPNNNDINIFDTEAFGKVLMSNCRAESTMVDKDDINEWYAKIDNWSLLYIPGLAQEIADYYIKLEEMLTDKANSVKLFTLEENGSIKDKDQPYTNKNRYSMQFKKKLQDASGETILGWIVLVVVHLMILFNYAVAYRSQTVLIGKKGRYHDDTGIRI